MLEAKQLRHRKAAAVPPPTPDRAASGPTASGNDIPGEQ